MNLIRRSVWNLIRGGQVAYIDEKQRVLVWMDETLWESVFNKLFVRRAYETEFFRPVTSDKFNARLLQVVESGSQ